MHFVAIFFNQATRKSVLLVNDAANFSIDTLHRGLGHIRRFGDRAAQENFTFIFRIDHRTQSRSHAVAHHHVASDRGRAFEIIACTRGHLVHKHLFGNAATEQHADLIEHVFAVVTVAVFFRQTHGHAQSATTRNDGHFVDWIAFRQQLTKQGVTGFMVSRVASLFFWHHHALALGTHQNLVLGLFKVLHFNHAGIATGSHQGSFVTQVRQVSPTHSRGTTGNNGRIHVLSDRNFPHVHGQNLLPTSNVGQSHINLAVKTSRAQQGGI